jgi:methylated-DNA-[protein]-cysteine S-methyltransferase
MSLIWSGQELEALSFGHKEEAQAWNWVTEQSLGSMNPSAHQHKLIRRLQAFASGKPEQFDDVQITLEPQTPFQRAVIGRCRKIPWGETRTYGELANIAGRPRAARAVGNVMATNRFPLIVPCHRVVAAGGALGGYSAPEGPRMKKRLLRLEGALL